MVPAGSALLSLDTTPRTAMSMLHSHQAHDRLICAATGPGLLTANT